MRSRDLELILLGLTLTTPISITVKAEVYFKEDQVVDAIFPGEKFQSSWIELSDEQVKLIEDQSGERIRERKVRVWKHQRDSKMVFIDRVIGKHDFITYAVGIDQGKVKQVEVMEYRETYGHEVRRPEWRQQ